MPTKRPSTGLVTNQRCLLEFDLAGAEWVVVAYLSGDARMIDIVETKKSPHVETGFYISGLPREIILKEHKLLGTMTDPIEIESIRREKCPEVFDDSKFLPRTMSVRQCGKKSNHGLNYVMGASRFSEELELPEADAKKIIHFYTRVAYPNIPVWWESIKRALKNNNRTLETCFGDRRTFLGEWNNELFKAATAYVPQSTVAEICKLGMVRAYRDEDLNSRWDLLANVHDSLLWQAMFPDFHQLAKDIIQFALNHMRERCEYGGREFYLDVECKMGLTWGSMLEVKLTKDVDLLAKTLKNIWGQIHEQQTAA